MKLEARIEVVDLRTGEIVSPPLLPEPKQLYRALHDARPSHYADFNREVVLIDGRVVSTGEWEAIPPWQRFHFEMKLDGFFATKEQRGRRNREPEMICPNGNQPIRKPYLEPIDPNVNYPERGPDRRRR